MKAWKGNIVYTPTKEKFEYLENSYLLIEQGRVKEIRKELPMDFSGEVVDFGDKIIIPAFTDLHMHPFQFPLVGNGYDKELLPWCRIYCGPAEDLSEDKTFADRMERDLLNKIWENGLLHTVMFPTMNGTRVEELMDLYEQTGMACYCGKCQDDMPLFDATPGESCEESMKEALRLAGKYQHHPRVKYIFTTGWALDASKELLKEMGKAAKEMDMPFQSHLDENRTEVKWVLQRHSDCKTYGEVYDTCDVFGKEVKTVMAHCIHTTPEEQRLLKENQVYVAHCVYSNFDLASGVMPLRTYLEQGIKVGLGSDISAGHTMNMFDIIRGTIEASKFYYVTGGKKPVTTNEAFYLATKGGGEFFGQTGSFEENYAADALVLDDGSLNKDMKRSLAQRMERIIYLGDERIITQRYFEGEEVTQPFAKE